MVGSTLTEQDCGEQFYRPDQKILFSAMSTHHILPEELEDKPHFTSFKFPEFDQPLQYVIGHSIDTDLAAVEAAGTNTSHFLGQVLIGLISCLLITLLCVSYFSYRTHAKIVKSFATMTTVANLVREQRAFNIRLPEANIVELNELSQDFNSLLDEIEQWHLSLIHRVWESKDLLHGTWMANQQMKVIHPCR
jgi:nitrate/nitrite-specific signal transduction histidine kinase